MDYSTDTLKALLGFTSRSTGASGDAAKELIRLPLSQGTQLRGGFD
jgi:hypothetical protein